MEAVTYPLFDRDMFSERIKKVEVEEAQLRALRDDLYEHELKVYEIATQLGRNATKPLAPYRPSGERLTDPRKDKVLEVVNRISGFGQDVTATDKDHESDDGCGHSAARAWRLIQKGDVFCLASVAEIDRFGWSGSKKSTEYRTYIFSSDGDTVLGAHGSIPPQSLSQFGRDHWSSIGYEAERMLTGLRRKQIFAKIEEVLELCGEDFEYTFENTKVAPVKVLRATLKEGSDNWTLQKGSKFHGIGRYAHENIPEPYLLRYDNDVTNAGFTIELDVENSIPRVHASPWQNHEESKIRDRHLDFFEELIEKIKHNVKNKEEAWYQSTL